jgi:hypothetical protein
MKRFILDMILSSVITTSFAVSSTHAGTIAVSSSINLYAEANAGGGKVTDVDNQSQRGTTNHMTASVRAVDRSSTGSVTATANASATFFGPDAGHIVLSNIGWTTKNVANGHAVLGGGNDFNYTFIPDHNQLFRLDYRFSAVGQNTFGLNGFWVDLYGDNVFSQTYFDLSQPQGTMIKPLTGGKSYFLRISNAADIYGGLGTREAHMTGVFDFQISNHPTPPTQPVPEPSTFALLGLGGIGLGVRVYRKRFALGTR